MKEELNRRIRRLNSCLEKIRGFLEWEKVNNSSATTGPPGGWSGLVASSPDLKAEIGNFYLLYDDLRNQLEISPKQIKDECLPIVNSAWHEYFTLVRGHPEIFD